MSEDLQDKTEEATPKKLQDARKKGQVAKSQDFTSGFLLMVSMIVLFFFGAYFYQKITTLTIVIFNNLYHPTLTHETASFWFKEGVTYVVWMMLPLLIAVFVMGFVANVVQVGFLVSVEPLIPKWKNLNVFNPQSYKRFFNSKAVMRLVLGVSKIIVVTLICAFMIYGMLPEISHMMKASTMQIFFFIAQKAFNIGLTIAILLTFLGTIDFTYQKWKFKDEMKMTKQEIKDERKQSEGDQQIKSKMRSMMQSYTQSRMKDNIPQADVIIANPVHYAIAIKYDPENMSAPICIAKGARLIALEIKELAKEHEVPIVENPPLARGLYKVVEIGMVVPADFYQAVAEVLAYVYRLNQEVKEKWNME